MIEPPLHLWLPGKLPRGVGDHLDRLRRTEGIAAIAIMPDVHLAAEFCVGTVVASDRFLYPNAVGGDIGCGMLALRFDTAHRPAGKLLADPAVAARLLGEFALLCPGRRHHRRTAHSLPAQLAELPMSSPHLHAQKNGEALRAQLGTLGAGNHFLELQAEECAAVVPDSGGAYGDGTAAAHQSAPVRGGEGDGSKGRDGDAFWLMLHTGSRHLGQAILRHHLPKARRLATGIFAIPADSSEGRAYLLDVAAARAWARENRRLLALRAADALHRLVGISPDLATLYDCDHNHVQLETHAGRPLFIHRKGATPAAAGLPGLIPGSMGTRSYHTLGKGQADSLCSSSHGAGRALSRAQARDAISRSTLRQQLRSRRHDLNPIWYDARLEDALREEAPSAYKPIEEVMAAQTDLTEIRRTLRPLLIHKAV
jgi:tRNA-splicing ligase RtcB